MRTRFNSFSITYYRLRIDDNGDLVVTCYAKIQHLLPKLLVWSYNVQIMETTKKAKRDVLGVCYDRKVFYCSWQYWVTVTINQPAEERGREKIAWLYLFSQNKH